MRSEMSLDSWTKDRRGLKGLTVWVDPAIHRQLRMMALELDRSAEDMLREAVGDLFQKHGRPRL